MMLTHMTMKFDGVAESSTEYDVEIDYDYEHRFAEHEHESKTEETQQNHTDELELNGLSPFASLC